ncbi:MULTISPECIES: amino acid adenylation domain-containing protein [Inquilinus]|uniref:Amino acid adenylation domain-containing protein n=1 Tax=Inquilinus ginsengisoli TaxID=363840 RepID=A0ABU1JGS8_9PROT|nr:amino acid adenylation domain-containing protein [Inquilinus ginsengisoli]MDR6287825.1 amino acid adenylation domain-containing protein [Inquilinus ginsengisoli]
MTVDAKQIARRFAGLAPDRRRAFLDKLAEHGVDFTELPIPPAPREGALPLSHAQRGLWLTWQRDPASPAYNMAGILALTGGLDVAALQAAVGDLVARHEALRTTFGIDSEGQPVQRIHAELPPPLTLRDLRASADGRGESDAFAQALAQQPFDLEAGPLLRLELHILGDRDHRLVLALHHIVADGWSIGLIIRDLAALYGARRDGAPSGLPALEVQYPDHAAWQRGWLEAGEEARQIGHWKAALGDSHPPLDLPFDRPRPAERSDAGAAHAFRLSKPLADALRGLARRHGASTFMVMLAVLKLLLARHGGGDDIRIGTPLANRRRAETHPMIGYFTNLVVLRTVLDQRRSFVALLDRVREGVLTAEAHADVPFDAVIEVLAPPRQAGVHPLFQVKCTEQADQSGSAGFAGLGMALHGLSSGAAHFDLSLDYTDRPDGIDALLAYTTDVFDAGTIARLAADFTALAEAVTAAPERRLADLPLAPVPATAFGPASAEPPVDLVAAWRSHAAARPEAVAVRHEERSVSRAQLDQVSDRLARRLIAHGVGPEDRVALQMGRTPEWVLGLLAVLKAGAAYLPLDPAAPAERRAELVADSGARWLLVDADTLESFGCEVLRLSLDDRDEEVVSTIPLPEAVPDQAAYLIYTSGSTGKPKGVVVTRGAMADYTRGVLRRLGLPEGTRMAMVSTVAADLGNTVLFGALYGGGELHLIDPARTFDPDRFAEYVAAQRIDVLKIVPSHLQALLQARRPQDALPAHTLVLGGEATSWPLLDRIQALAPGCRVLNHYGPTETTVGALCQPASEASRAAGTLPIGAPLPDASAHVLDDYLNPVPAGAAGELYLGGPGVARGYLGRAAQTAERFVPDPFGAPGARLYRTGDRVRRLRDGSLEFLGRVDDQVKIRGYRVEPGEVATALRGLDGIADAAVVALAAEDGRLQLVAYVAAPAGFDLDAVKARLGALLPDYMVPAAFMRLDALPVTANGKLDRRALPAPVVAKAAGDPPRGDTEVALAAIWAALLGTDAIGRDDNFFALGGDSILSLKLLARIRKQGLPGGKALSLADILNAGSLAALAARIAPAEPTGPDVVHLQRDGAGVPLYCIPGLIVNSTEFASMVAALGGDRPVTGFVSHVYTAQRWRGYDMAALAEEFAAHIERTATGGRCALLGWSSGGDLAFETAHRLAGRVRIDFLGMVDVFESVDFRAERDRTPEERERAAALLEQWLGRSQMAAQWRPLFALMDEAERAALDDYVLAHGDALPVDGPDLLSREFELWATLDKRLRAARYRYRPLGLPVHVWQAEDSLGRPEQLRDWSALAPVAELALVPGAKHLDIIHDAGFQAGVRDAMRQADSAAVAVAAQ